MSIGSLENHRRLPTTSPFTSCSPKANADLPQTLNQAEGSVLGSKQGWARGGGSGVGWELVGWEGDAGKTNRGVTPGFCLVSTQIREAGRLVLRTQ